MKILMALAFVLGLVVGSEEVLAAKAKGSSQAKACAELKTELLAMQKAQQTIMQSLVSNHQTFAVALEEYSATATLAPKVASQEMKRSAQSFRSRGVQGQKMANRLNNASSDLIARVALCL